MMTVDRVMNAQFSTLTISDSVDMARQLMTEKAVQYLPVVDNEGESLGLVYQADLLGYENRASEKARRKRSGSEKESMKLSDIMRTDFETVSPGSGIRQAATGLHGQIPECLLVVDKNQLVGVLTSSDFLGITITLLQEREQEQEEPKFSDLGEDAEIEELNEGDLAGVFIEKTEDEDWDRLDL